MPPIQRSAISLERLCQVCERFYARDGFVKWSEVGDALGISRQAVQLRLRAAVTKGDIPPETVERWQSLASRAAAARERREKGWKEKNVGQFLVKLTPENHQWLQEEAAYRRVRITDIINGLVTCARESAETREQSS